MSTDSESATRPSTGQPPSLFTPGFVNVMVMQMAFGCSISTFLLLPKYLSQDLHASASQIGIINALPGLAAVIVTPFLSGILDRRGRKPLITLGACLSALYACAWLSIEHVGPLTYALQLLFGISFVIVFNAAGTLATEEAPPERLGQAIGLFGAANISMNAIAPSLAEPLAARYGWDAAFMLSACSALLALVLSRHIREPPRSHPQGTRYTLRMASDDARALLRLASRLRAQTLTMISCGATFGAIFTFYQPFVLAQGAKQVSAFFVGFTLSTVSTRLLLGSLADRFGRRRVAFLAYIAYASTALAMIGMTPSLLLPFGAVFGCVHGLFYPALNALAVEQTQSHERSRVMTLINGSFHLGNMSSVFCFGWVAEHGSYSMVFVLASIVGWLGVLALHLDKRAAGGDLNTTRA